MTDHPEDGAPEEAEEQRRPRGSSVRLQNLANLLAIAVGVAAIGLAVWQGYENRRFYRLSVLPHLEQHEADWGTPQPILSEYFLFPDGTDSVYAVGYSVANTGLGPAALRDFLVYRDGEVVFAAAASGERYTFSDVKADLNRLPFPTLKLNFGYAAGQLLAEDEIHHLISVGVPMEAVDEAALDRPVTEIVKDVLETYSFVFCYCSVYQSDCGTTYVGAEPPVERACRS